MVDCSQFVVVSVVSPARAWVAWDVVWDTVGE
jgi:hypothetical protein